ncbi:MAG: haloacid dehalogenase [Chloroflexi bacterium]|nr:haloacid dehalogenase [Chloroflexota bacterium]
MDRIDEIGDNIRQMMEAKNAERDAALASSRTLIRHCANSIRAVHRGEFDLATDLLAQAGAIVDATKKTLTTYPDLYWTGYVQDAQKEFAEANLVFAIAHRDPIPSPGEVGVELAPYLNGLGEAAGEMRRYALDLIRRQEMKRSEQILAVMEDIYGLLVTIDFPDALTGGLRRTTDMVRGVLERTRGDLTMSIRQSELEQVLSQFEAVVRGHTVVIEDTDREAGGAV